METSRRNARTRPPNSSPAEADIRTNAINPPTRPQYAFYGRELLKRNFGTYARLITDKYYREARCYGSGEHPLLVLCHLDTVPEYERNHLVQITVEKGKKNWNSVVSACLFLGVKFLIMNRKFPLAVLKRHDKNRHPAFTYLSESTINARRFEQDLAAMQECIDQLTVVKGRIAERLRPERPE